jgi:hypothetical protein
MKINAFFFRGIAVGFLWTAGLAGCQKEAVVNEDFVTASKVTPALTVGLPSVIVGWGALQNSIPYLDHSTDGDVTYVQYPQGFTINGIGFVCGGRMFNKGVEGGFSPELFQYDPTSMGWEEKLEFQGPDPSVLALGINFVIGDNVYIIGKDKKTYRYNQPGDKWSTVAAYPGTSDTALCGFSVNGLGYAGMGTVVNGYTSSDWWQYDPVGNKWHAMTAFPGNSRMSAACFTVDGKGYLVGGLHVIPANRGLGTTVWQYTPGGISVNGSWKEMKDFPGSARYEAGGAAGTIGGADVGFVVGGVASGDVVQGDVWTYYPPGDSWNKEPNIAGGPRENPAVFVIGHSLFVANENVDVMGWSR